MIMTTIMTRGAGGGSPPTQNLTISEESMFILLADVPQCLAALYSRESERVEGGGERVSSGTAAAPSIRRRPCHYNFDWEWNKGENARVDLDMIENKRAMSCAAGGGLF
jgi:hypothetical protein